MGPVETQINTIFQSMLLLKCDITSSLDIKNTIKHILSIENHIDVLINNAGIGITGPLRKRLSQI